MKKEGAIGALTIASPDNGLKAHCKRNSPDTVVHIAIRGTPEGRGDANGVLDDLAGIT